MKINPVLNLYPNIYSAKNLEKTNSKSFFTNSIEPKVQPVPVSFKWYSFGLGDSERKFDSIEEWLNYNLNFKCKDNFRENELSNLLTSNQNMQKFSSDLYRITRSKTFSKGGITVGQFVDILKKQEVLESDEILSNLTKCYLNKPDVIKTSIEVKHSYFNYLIDELSKLDPNSDFLENGDDVMKGIADSYYKKIDEDFAQYNQSIKEKLEYSDSSEVETFDLLTEIKKLPQERQDEIEQKFNGNYDKMMKRFIAEGLYCSRYPIEYSVGVDSALIQMLPRYIQEKQDDFFEIAPLSRRLSIDDMDDFMLQFKEGDIYSFPHTQSVSKDMSGSEVHFNDSHRHQNVVFRIHPKSKMTKSYDVKDIDAYAEAPDLDWDDAHSRHYRSESLYLPNAKFKVLGSHKYITNTYMFGCDIPDYYKTIIDLQEV